MSEINQIIRAAIELQQAGKTPSTVLLKTKTQNQFNLPVIIRGLKAFKSLSADQYPQWLDKKSSLQKHESKPEKNLHEQRIEQLEKQVAALTQQYQKVQQQINQLELNK